MFALKTYLVKEHAQASVSATRRGIGNLREVRRRKLRYERLQWRRW
jgi:hypothetical protein